MMKKITFFLVFALVGTMLNAQNVNIPDANFKNALINHNPTIDTDGNGDISTAEAQAYTGEIYVYNQNISDLTGIEAFVNLTELVCSYNQLTSLNVSANTALTGLYCRNNQLTSLDVSTITALTIINCRDNQLTSLDISTNTALTELYCQNNQLTSLDVSANTALTKLYCGSNQLTSLNAANGNNGIQSPELFAVNATGNPNLTCIQHDTGFDPTTAQYWGKDATAQWSDNCPPVSSCTNIVNIPDANFKNALLAHGASAPVNGVNPIIGAGVSVIDTDGDGEICENEAQAYTGKINVVSQNVSDLTGIEAFITATTLWCDNNTLTSLNVSSNTALLELSCQNNQLTSLDVNSALKYLYCKNNQLTSLDVSNNTNLVALSCFDNQLTSLDVSANTSLADLFCNSNQLTTLDVANGNNGALGYMRAYGNPNLTCIQHDAGFDPTTANNWTKDATAQWSDNCSAVPVTSISVQGQGGASTITTNGGTLQMETTVLPSNATDGTYTWSVTNGTGSATIDANGLLTAATNGTVDVIATANDGSGVTGSATITISNQGTAIYNVGFEDFKLYPNPASDRVFLELEEKLEHIQILDLSGKVIKSFDANSRTLDVSDLPEGVYFLEVSNAKKHATVKLIMN